MPVALTVAGSDSGGGAGIQADLKTFAAHDVYGVCAVTAVTAQNTLGVVDVHLVPPSSIAAQVAAIARDFPVAAAKTGMLGSAGTIVSVADALHEWRIPNLVLDPVMLAKSGAPMLDPSALDVLRTRLLPLAHVVTPNIPEAEALTGMRIASSEDAAAAARRLVAMGPRMAIVTGGHAHAAEIVDTLWDGATIHAFRHERVPGASTHGTGCTFAAALAAHLARGVDVPTAVPLVQRYIAGAIRRAPRLGAGHGPMHHWWNRPEPSRLR
jgi:hydroxymethylpyrimidine/phosphomethylpyrimidine kinase